ncbi:MAG: Re/Si-specific NAD(P)(+) transhydrogenase subunit alpha [Phycisphaerales bacterium]|nr:Re/Si-specific NAD(P)(+) transhydrogenase subunit alpha [Phycisphaerales bacterium]MCB9854339.1 Re/Si-specific NAD(P)(+) transhydrogenase subunit alpha [Phycisphaerales bacterium]MCB9863540.1 Re/Si-specific NAD(P)(+) transhydrogenase subunit alpha [Phycisphaerales bacterium]
MNIGIPRSTDDGELRVAIVPETAQRLKKLGLDVIVETGAGAAAGFSDDDYTHAGATIASSAADVFARADAIAIVHAPNDETFGHLRKGQMLFAVIRPLTEHDLVKRLADAGVTAIAMDMMPRISRAQKMDVLSSMSTIAGYKGVLLAAAELTKMFPMMMTAAGTITPAKVLILGAGVAGLQAIATARRLGAVVEAFDVRPAVKEQVESLGARFVEVAAPQADAEDAGGYAKEMSEDYKRKQGELVDKHARESDIVISTALIPGKKAPILISAETVRGMKSGAVIMDLAAEGGGNCELTKLGERVVEKGVVILGPRNLPSSVPFHASQMFSRNVGAFLQDLTKEGKIRLSEEDECVVGTVITQDGEVKHARVREMMGLPPLVAAEGSPA